ncbi:MAG TPA: hypothetical protein ENH85_02625 [Candidatus Scalindua sp.]|nr:hypothetical protein [Candidatus Scalindua sp.]
MKKWIIILILLLAGCSNDRSQIFNFDPDKVIYIPPGAVIEWDDIDVKSLPKGQQGKRSGRDVKIVKGIILGDIRTTKDYGYFISEDILKEVDRIQVEEDLSYTWSEKLFNLFGL